MFSDSQIVQDFQLGPGILNSLTNWDLAPYFKDKLKKEINDSQFISIGVDKNLNQKHRSVKWMLRCGIGMRRIKKLK